LGSTRSSGRYRFEMTKEVEHRELAATLSGCRATVVLSGYPSELYDELYAEWYRVDVPFWTGQGGSKKSRVEVIWSNRPVIMQADLFEDTAI
jgi:DNA adenine methylase